MSTRSLRTPRLWLVVLPVVAALFATLAMATPANAKHERVTLSKQTRQTSSCPCSLPDEHDGTYFLRDSGGKATKMRIYDKGRLAGKVEFHPQGEKLWIYDTLSNNDAIYYQIRWADKRLVFSVPSGKSHEMIDLKIPEGTPVVISAWDDRDGWNGKLSNFLGQAKVGIA